MGRHPIRVHEHLNDPRPAAHDIGPRHILDARKSLRHFLCHPPQIGVVRGLTGQRQSYRGHVVDLHRLHDPPGNAERHDVQILVDFLVELDQAPLAVLSHVVTHGDDRLVLAAHRIDVLHAVDLIEDLF